MNDPTIKQAQKCGAFAPVWRVTALGSFGWIYNIMYCYSVAKKHMTVCTDAPY